ncbi:MAG: hypothetical protein LBI63_03230 [Candidatus Ancillula sp.]|jgi:hypothetical protein|nr:hypothetical protein [Candidatus Ancillula sp.]
MAQQDDVIVYGNWKRPTSPGILGLGLIGTGILFAHLLLSVAFAMMNLIYAILWFIIGGLTIYVIVRKDKHNMSILYRFLIKFNYSRMKSAKRGIYRSGPLSHINEGHFRLPGIAANTTLMSYYDPQGREIGVLCHGNTHISLVMASEPEGSALVDQDQINSQVGRYGNFLNSLNNEPGLSSVSITVETEPENGLKLVEEIQGHLATHAPAFALETAEEIGNTYSAGSSATKVYTAFTYSFRDLNAKDQGISEVLLEIISRMPPMCSALEASGAGVPAPMSSAQIYKTIRTAFDPASRDLFDSANTNHAAPVVDWKNVGPTIAVNEWNKYVHDSGVSVSYIMSQAPRGVVTDSVLSRLMQPHPQLQRKRITFVYKPVSYEQSATMVEADVTNAAFTANSQKRASARQTIAVQKAAQAASEEARGASLIKFGMLATITLDSSDDITKADAVLNNLSANAHIVLRKATGTQDSAFVAGLPLGLSLDTFYSPFDSIKEML